MRILLIGKRGSITHWLEDAVAALAAEGHATAVGLTRRPWLAAAAEAAVSEMLADAVARRATRFAPQLVLAMGGFHVSLGLLERLRALPGRPALAGWVGDRFGAEAAPAAELYDLVAYTDSGLLARHAELGLPGRSLFLPHAANLAAPVPPARARTARMVFVAGATPGRLATVASIAASIDVHGPGWRALEPTHHEVYPRVAHRHVAGLYAGALAALNVRNERNVLAGLNQRSFAPYLTGTPVVSDPQADLERCFALGDEVVVWHGAEDLNAAYDRLRRAPDQARRIGEAGRRRVLAEHGYGHRLAALLAAL